MNLVFRRLEKRKRQSPSPITTEIGRRLQKFRGGQRNLWDDDDDDDDSQPYVQPPKLTPSDDTYIVLSDSDDEKASSRRRRSRSNKSKKKSSQTRDESLPSDNDNKPISKCATCLICSILTTLTSYNCCSKHLSILVNGQNPCHNHQKQMINTDQWPPQQVMIVPMTDEFMQRYLDPQKIHCLRTQTSTSPTNKKTDGRNTSARKLSKKSTMTSQLSDTEQLNVNKSKSSTKSSRVNAEPPEQTGSSSIIIESALPNSGTIPADTTFTIIGSTSTTINSFESPNVLDTCQLQSSSEQPIIIDDSQSENTQENLQTKTTNENKQNDPWTPISEETYAAIEIALDRTDQPCEDQTEFTPSAARRTPTEQMASCLPKIQLRQGRFRRGKPIADKNSTDTVNEQRSLTTSQSSISTSVITINTRPPTSLATIAEDESLIVQSIRHISERSCHVLSERHENTSEELSDTVMSRLLAQDEASQHDTIPIATKTLPNEAVHPPPPPLPPPAIIIEDCSSETEINRSVDTSQSSQLTNDQNDTQPSIPSTTNEKPTPTRVSYRTNPDGSRVSISRPPLPTAHQSPLISLRRISTDVAPITSYTKK